MRNGFDDSIAHIGSCPPELWSLTSQWKRAGDERDCEAFTVFANRPMSMIAIYEENDLMRALLKEWLCEAGYRVREVIRRDVKGGGTEDLVIASVYMPKQAGVQLLREVQATHPGTPLIAISAQFSSAVSAAGTTAQLLGVERALAKPLSRGDLLDAVRAIIGGPS